MTTSTAKGRAFRDLHATSHTGAFVIPNPWDVGTARLLAHLGFRALATTSMGFAFSTGRRDTAVGRDEMVAHVEVIAGATGLPVSADLEDGYADSPAMVAETIRLAAQAGAVGGSIEDATGDHTDPIRDIGPAVERLTAAAEAAHSLPFPFMLTGRAENYLHGRPDLADTIRRLQAYQEAGADVLYAPGLTTPEEIAEVVRSVDRPVNVLMGLRGAELTVAELSAVGVARISVGSALYRAALGAFLAGAEEIRDRGTFTFASAAVAPAVVDPVFDD
ncbi:MAG TPA: isocitrate lyase/phosphoenolpyruvate mutase family protein [Nocardioidaceae bacterium]|nr:isocitrate lyase/phosphoenolpyruvate mutase family protein [Nocardioidaceae bacterium]